ncbi:MAG: hypothetical protein LT071_03220 [Nocardioides sp.]|nr:hypothetical protein [Nocardioides sp.]
MKRSRVSLSVLAAVAVLSLSACGSDPSSAPDDASVKDFCAAVNESMFGTDTDPTKMSAEEIAEASKDYADKLAEVGTPEDMPADARAAFESMLEEAEEIDVDEIRERQQMKPEDLIKKAEEEANQLSDEEKKQSEALSKYIVENCMDDLDLPELPETPSAE